MSIPPTMDAIRLHAPGGPEELVFEQIETPRPRVGEALVRVDAARSHETSSIGPSISSRRR